jgi:hypothetical protein
MVKLNIKQIYIGKYRGFKFINSPDISQSFKSKISTI